MVPARGYKHDGKPGFFVAGGRRSVLRAEGLVKGVTFTDGDLLQNQGARRMTHWVEGAEELRGFFLGSLVKERDQLLSEQALRLRQLI